MTASNLYIGTAGWNVPAAYKEQVPATGSHLQRYAATLNAVEINSSFYRHHQTKTYARWSMSVPETFRFCVKVPRTVTHDEALQLQSDELDQFIEEVTGLGGKLAVLLVQLPPGQSFDPTVVRRFFRTLRKKIDADLVCEPRHRSWASPRADGLLAEHGVARVATDPAPWPGSEEPGGARDHAYFRWHGFPRMYYSNYDAASLDRLHIQLDRAAEQASSVWTIFDNTAAGFAFGNALSLAALAQREASVRGAAGR